MSFERERELFDAHVREQYDDLREWLKYIKAQPGVDSIACLNIIVSAASLLISEISISLLTTDVKFELEGNSDFQTPVS